MDPDPKESPPAVSPSPPDNQTAGEKSPRQSTPASEPNALTPEEQMEKFAQELKEQDWGHQPC
jgi:hypothetical protein